MFKSLFAGLVIAAAASAAATTTINFDNLDGSGNQAVPNGYDGLSWTNFYVYDAVNDPGNLRPSGYHDVVRGVQSWVSANNVAFSAFVNDGAIPVVSSATVFSLNSVYLHSVWDNGLQVEVIGSLAGLTTYDHTYTLDASATEPTFINFGNNLLAVDSVQFIPSETAATTAFYTRFYGPYFAMDNMAVDFLPTLAAVPEPSTWLAAALALGVIGFSQRKRLRACASSGGRKHS